MAVDIAMLMKGVRMPSRLQQLRKAANMSQGELARRVGVSRPTVSRWETEEYMPSKENMTKIADALGVSVESLRETPEERHLRTGDYVMSERDVSAWRDLVIRDPEISQWQQVILMSLPVFIDRIHWVVLVTVDQFIRETGRSQEMVEGSWQSAIDSPYVEAVGEVKWALRLVFP